MKKNLLILLSLVTFGGSISAMQKQLTDQIKADIYKVFKQEMWIVSKDFSAMRKVMLN